jgi:SAM-dependent methyltransferase
VCNTACIHFIDSKLQIEEVKGKNVIEVGSLNVNGSVRPTVESMGPASYLGVDIIAGPGVDEICDVNDLLRRYGKERFDIVISTELLEHVRDWRLAVSNLKNVLKPDGILLISTRSKGFHYHGYPFDFWRYEPHDADVIFSDLYIDYIGTDPEAPGIFVKARKLIPFKEKDFISYELYSIIKGKRCRNIHNIEIFCFKIFRYIFISLRKLLKRILPERVQSGIKNIIMKTPLS